jgi:hypothetical protein
MFSLFFPDLDHDLCAGCLLVLYNFGISGRTIFFSHLLVNREQSKNNKIGMYSKIIFKWKVICCQRYFKP